MPVAISSQDLPNPSRHRQVCLAPRRLGDAPPLRAAPPRPRRSRPGAQQVLRRPMLFVLPVTDDQEVQVRLLLLFSSSSSSYW